MKPFIQVKGQGPDLVMLHGWGSHKGIWGTFADQLSRRFTLHLVDLPGHGESSRQDGRFNAPDFAQAVLDHTPPAAWLGSSLGGLIAMKAALDAPKNIHHLVLISTNPCFVATSDWPYAQDPAVFERFMALPDSGVAQTLQYFSKLEVAGSDRARETLARLAKVQSILPSAEALRSGLEILAGEDLVNRLGDIAVPTLLISGEADRLVPAEAAREAARRIPGAKLKIVSGAGHAPFVSHADMLIEPVSAFLSRKRAA